VWNPTPFYDSSHQAVGCASCHASMSYKHPTDDNEICRGEKARTSAAQRALYDQAEGNRAADSGEYHREPR
jgi:hypothetical protein